jgi:hypothetical protein
VECGLVDCEVRRYALEHPAEGCGRELYHFVSRVRSHERRSLTFEITFHFANGVVRSTSCAGH